MKLADRMKIAGDCARIAEAHDATVTIEPQGISGKEQETIVRLEWPRLSASFSICGSHHGGVLVSFFGAKRDLRHAAVFDSINEYHKRKATTYCDDMGPAFMSWFKRMCMEVREGKVFEETAG